MPLHFRKSVKIAPGVKVNFGKKSTSVSVGPRSAKITMGTNGTHVSTGIPGTGLYYRKKISGRKGSATTYAQQQIPLRTRSENVLYGTIFLLLAVFAFASAVFWHFQPFGRVVMGGLGAFMTLGSVIFYTAKCSDREDIDYSDRTIKNPTAFVAGILVLIGCLVVYIWGEGATWTGHSKTNIYIRHDYRWFRNCIYFFLVIAGIIGTVAFFHGFKEEE